MPEAVRGVAALLRLLPVAGPRRSPLFAAGIVLGAALPVTIAVLTGLLIGSVPATVDSGFDSGPGRDTLSLLAAVGGLILVQRVTDPVLRASATMLGRDVDLHLQGVVLRAVGRPDGIAHLEDPVILDRLRIVRGLGVDSNRPSLAVTALSRVLPSWLRALGSAAVLLAFHWWLGLLWLATWPVVLYLMQREYVRVGKVTYGQSSALRRAEYLRDLAITAPAAKEIRVWGMLGWLIDRFEAAWRGAIEPVWRSRKPRLLVLVGTSGAVTMINLGTLGLLASAAIRGDLSLAALAVYVQALSGANSYLAFDDDNAYLSHAAVSVPRILDLDDELASAAERTGIVPAGIGGTERAATVTTGRRRPGEHDVVVGPDAPVTGVRFDDVGFCYPHSGRAALAGLDLVVPAHRSLAIVGRNGAGKTSLVKLLCGLYQPTSGRVGVDGHDILDLDLDAWRRRVAVLFQDFARYQLPVRDNVGLGAPDLGGDLDRLRSAADQAGALDLIESLPHGWDTVLSREYTGGTDLSGGQWQRIALARAMFAVEAGATVLVLDEPTAALDVRAEAELYDRFLELTEGLTTCLVSHRFSTVRLADRIVVLADGAVAEVGDHDELIARGGRYAEMFTLQAARFKEVSGRA